MIIGPSETSKMIEVSLIYWELLEFLIMAELGGTATQVSSMAVKPRKFSVASYNEITHSVLKLHKLI